MIYGNSTKKATMDAYCTVKVQYIHIHDNNLNNSLLTHDGKVLVNFHRLTDLYLSNNARVTPDDEDFILCSFCKKKKKKWQNLKMDAFIFILQVKDIQKYTDSYA